MGIEGTYLSIIKASYVKPTVNIILNSKKLKVFPLKSATRQVCPLSPLLFSIVLEVLATAIKQKKEIKCIQIGREEVKLSLCANDMVLYIGTIYSTKDSTKNKQANKKQPEQINEFNKVAKYKIYIQKSLAFLYTNNEISERGKKNPF